jgi:hypothetical protein
MPHYEFFRTACKKQRRFTGRPRKNDFHDFCAGSLPALDSDGENWMGSPVNNARGEG